MIHTVSVSPFEYVPPGFSLRFDLDRPVDEESARAGVRLRGLDATVEVTLGGRRVRVRPAAPLPPGRHVLEIDPLRGARGRAVGGPRSIPFFVADTLALVPSTLRVGSFTRLVRDGLLVRRLPPFARPAGAFVDLLKTTHRATRARRVLAFDHDGAAVDPGALQRAVQESRAARFGKLHPGLFERMARGPEALDVALWLRHDGHPAPGDRSPDVAARGPTDAGRARLERIASARRAFIERVASLGLSPSLTPDPRAPVVYATMAPDAIRRAAADPAVAAVFYVDRTMVLDLDVSLGDARADAAHAAGVEGKGVRVAVFEDGPDDTSQLVIAGSYLATPATSDHSRLVHAVIRNNQPVGSKGFAPECALYSANDRDVAALAWAVGEGCTVISQSFHRKEAVVSPDLSFDDVYKDWLALDEPYPTVVQAAGNLRDEGIVPADSEYVNHKGYNGLTVGGHRDGAAEVWDKSAFRNPASPNGDRELPELCANATTVSAVGVTKTGTSFASPAVAGCVALVQGVDGVLRSWPQGCRAVLLAGARGNLRGGAWWDDVSAGVDALDGSGVLDAMESVEIARRRVRRNRAGSRRGWDVGTLSPADFDATTGESTFRYRVAVPRGARGPRHVKVALAWNALVKEQEVGGERQRAPPLGLGRK